MSGNIEAPDDVPWPDESQPSGAPGRYRPKFATNAVPMQCDHLGQAFWESYSTPESYEVHAQALVPPQMPGIIIFVHGVNSEGEWYNAAERALCAGLNDRLGRTDLMPNAYLETNPDTDKPAPRRIDPKNAGHSPVIRFYWGYCAKKGEERRWHVPLRNVDGEDMWAQDGGEAPGPWYWGGGPFQNGTNNLQQLWSEKGFDRHLLGFFNLQWFNTEWDRELNDAPGRQYYAHAAQRLADLIDRIRTRNPGDTITVMSHSQGTMIAMAATLMCKTRAPDSLVVMNSPYALVDKTTDALTCFHQRPTTAARINTFRNVAKRIKQDRKIFTPEERELLHVGATQGMELWHPESTYNGVQERDNHGRFYVYFNPHDRVMGSVALQSIGWQGVSDELLEETGDTVKQRMLARGTACGGEPGPTPFGTLPPISNPESGVKPTDFWNGNHGVAGINLWAIPHPDQRVNINAEKVPNPITAEELSQSAPRTVTHIKEKEPVEVGVDSYFDESRTDQNILGTRDANGHHLDSSVPYLLSVHAQEKRVTVPDIYAPSGHSDRLETREEMVKRIEDYLPMPTNHSTLPQNQGFMRRVAAWDLPIGFCESYESREFWASLVRDADWIQLTDRYFTESRLEVPPMPDGIDHETVADEITRVQQQRQKLGFKP